MIFPFFRRSERPGTISTLYGMIVAQARLACFYRDYAVPDTINGRFDLIVLHLALVLDRLSQDRALQPLSQGLFDRFCRDMDDNLREMGVSDLKVPREMQRMGEAFYGRAQAYRAALAAPDDAALIEALRRNLYSGEAGASAPRLAAYVREALRQLSVQQSAKLAAGELSFPDPFKLRRPRVKRLILMDKTIIAWSVPVTVEDIPDTGLHKEIDAPEAARAAVAELAGLRELPQLGATFDLTRQGTGVHVSGVVKARVGQTCVVTLEPIENAVNETVDLKFVPGEPAPSTARKKKTQGGDEPPEPLVGGTLDLGALATEFLILGIDPYPRRPDAQFDTPQGGKSGEAGERPFAALAALKDRLGSGKA